MALRLLLVEDNALNRDMLRRRLDRHGFEVLEAVDGLQALDLAAQARPDCILMDLSLPLLDGWEATRRLKLNPLTAAIPVIALTAHALHEDADIAFQAGCDAYATKPVDFLALCATITRLSASVPLPVEVDPDR